MEDYKKGLGLFVVIVLIAVLLLAISGNKNKKEEVVTNEDGVEEELYIDQIYFKNIQMLDELPIDQSLLIQDEIMYHFIEKKKDVEEVELIEGSLNKLEDYNYTFKVKYKDGTIGVYANKDKIEIK